MIAPWPLVAGLPAAGLPAAGLLPDPELPPWPGITPTAVPTTEPTAELTVDAGPPAGWPAVSALEVVPAEPGFCAEPGVWSAAARPARSTAKTSAAANPPHAYRQTLRASKARERVADPSTANTLPLMPIIMYISAAAGRCPACSRSPSGVPSCIKAVGHREKITTIRETTRCRTIRKERRRKARDRIIRAPVLPVR